MYMGILHFCIVFFMHDNGIFHRPITCASRSSSFTDEHITTTCISKGTYTLPAYNDHYSVSPGVGPFQNGMKKVCSLPKKIILDIILNIFIGVPPVLPVCGLHITWTWISLLFPTLSVEAS